MTRTRGRTAARSASRYRRPWSRTLALRGFRAQIMREPDERAERASREFLAIGQWQTPTNSGSTWALYRTAPQRQPPLISICFLPAFDEPVTRANLTLNGTGL